MGWDAFFSSQLDLSDGESKLIPGRVVTGGKKVFRVQIAPGEPSLGEIRGRIKHEANSKADLPAVGDWVLCEILGPNQVSIERILERKTLLSRRSAGTSNDEQVLATNVDTVFIVTSMNTDFNVARLERYLTAVRMSGATPVIVLTKADLTEDPASYVEQARKLLSGLAVHSISSVTGAGVSELDVYLTPGSTSVLLGSSGVGKSTLLNRLFGNSVAETQEIRESDDRGRHTTTERSLWRAQSGALIIDTPGMRELQLWDDDGSALGLVFSDVEALALRCKFTNCKHESEPGCKIKSALASGELTQERYASYLKLQGELNAQRRKVDKEFASNEKQRTKKLTEAARARSHSKKSQ